MDARKLRQKCRSASCCRNAASCAHLGFSELVVNVSLTQFSIWLRPGPQLTWLTTSGDLPPTRLTWRGRSFSSAGRAPKELCTQLTVAVVRGLSLHVRSWRRRDQPRLWCVRSRVNTSCGQRNDQNILCSLTRVLRNMGLKCRTGTMHWEDTCSRELQYREGNQVMHFQEHSVSTIMRRFSIVAVLLFS
jgi:hypothetical protein